MRAPLASSPSLTSSRWLTRAAVSLSWMLCLGCLSGDGGGADSDLTTPVAQFSQSETAGTPGTVVSFVDESTGTIESLEWDFGPLGTRTEANPSITFQDPGNYTVRLTVRGPGGESVLVQENLIVIGDLPTAGFECSPLRGLVPLTVTCTDSSEAASEIVWDFGDGGASNDRSPAYVFETPGSFIIEQTAINAVGERAQQTTVEVVPFAIVSSIAGGSAPLDVVFSVDVGSAAGFAAWTIDGQNYLGNTISHRFAAPGTFDVEVAFGDLTDPNESRLNGTQVIEYTVDYGRGVAGFEPSTAAGPGPLSVTLEDQSGGAIEEWVWNFGDGSTCTFPDPNEPGASDPVPVCDAQSPTHEYAEVGSYDVRLQIRGPGENEGDAVNEDEAMVVDAIRVTALDPSFEGQETDAELGLGWITLRPELALVEATHIALEGSGASGDVGMPTEGTKWALLDGRGTDGSEEVDLIKNGIEQRIMPPADQPVLEFDYVLLYAEPPAAGTLDALTATISDGSTVVEIDSARTDVSAAYAGPSARFPMEDGGTVRATAVHTASVNLSETFPGATGPQFYTLTIRTTNALNELRSPRVYVDNLRFTEAADPILAAFSIEGGLPVFSGEPVRFRDETCVDSEVTDCVVPTSWRWNFGTQAEPRPPASAASDEQDPLYTFPEAGNYEVRLLTRLGDQESEATLFLTALEAHRADFEVLTAGPYLAPVSIEFGNLSTSDPSDPIAAWSWDFGGWGTSTQKTPDSVIIGQAGEVTVRLTITTDSGRTNTAEMMIEVN